MTGMAILAIVVAGLVATFTDWLFMGVLFHDRYMKYPEVWRDSIRGNDRTAVHSWCALDFVAAAGIVAVCLPADIHTLWPALGRPFFAWLAGPLVISPGNGFIRDV